ncbi:hypothetical protein [Arthrobacter sp. ISL-65]|uniref:hypothetical protein n=1 Tax=Arthrobacter sp. ISL-65 TaxID=2819112 RepID=UPI001BE8CD06|nr:hypothetical protein [Arthrobacter sp. ISL-65]MBT2550561.1 hypothetical protein [Arthrobacter sp. ISL-65]
MKSTASSTTGKTHPTCGQIIDKVLSFPEYFGPYQRQLFGLDFGGIPEAIIHDEIDLLSEEILPVLRREMSVAPTAAAASA